MGRLIHLLLAPNKTSEHHILSSPARANNRVLREAQSSSLDHDDDDDDFFLGCIQANCDPVREVQKVARAVEEQTRDYYGDCPEIQIVQASAGNTTSRNENYKFTYVPHHLHYMVGELLKNSCRATVKRHVETGSRGPLPPIRVVIVKGAHDVTIKVEDRGGGIPRSNMDQIWTFAHSTEKASDENETEFGVDEMTGARIRGFGLPLARIYARYLGGELVCTIFLLW